MSPRLILINFTSYCTFYNIILVEASIKHFIYSKYSFFKNDWDLIQENKLSMEQQILMTLDTSKAKTLYVLCHIKFNLEGNISWKKLTWNFILYLLEKISMACRSVKRHVMQIRNTFNEYKVKMLSLISFENHTFIQNIGSHRWINAESSYK